MKYGLYCPTFDVYSDPKYLIELAKRAEEAGWDGFFIWDHILLTGSGLPVADAIITLAGIAVSTSKIKFGPMVTPIPRRRPWKLAKEIITLDHLSDGRVILGAGIGSPDWEYTLFGEDADLRIRAEKLDEGLTIINKMCQGKRFDYEGMHFKILEEEISPGSFQTPRIPVWLAGTYGYKGPFRRAARWDGVFPLKMDLKLLRKPSPSIRNWASTWLSHEQLNEIIEYINKKQTSKVDFDVVITGSTLRESVSENVEKIQKFEKIGATWWLEWILDAPALVSDYEELIDKGPIK